MTAGVDRARVAGAYAVCGRIARRHYENFPVASRLLPRRMRPHIAAVYAFARVADDFADEGHRSSDERLRLLDGWTAGLRRAALAAGGVSADAPTAEGGGVVRDEEASQIFLALGESIRECRLPPSLFEDLLSAFRQDVTTHRYRAWDDVLDYCRRSANPVGRLVLRIGGYDDRWLDEASDAVCTALQLTNFWQDLGPDWKRGRLYVPLAELAGAGAGEGDLDRRDLTPAWRRVMGLMVERTRALFQKGRPVCDGVGGRLRLELRLTWLGGTTILDRVERAGFDVFRHRPALSSADAPRLLWRALMWPAPTGRAVGR